jgi:hypothetical protein
MAFDAEYIAKFAHRSKTQHMHAGELYVYYLIRKPDHGRRRKNNSNQH